MSVISFQDAARQRPKQPLSITIVSESLGSENADTLGCVMFTSAEMHGLALLRNYEQGLFKDVTLTASGQSAAYHFRQTAQDGIFMSIGKIRNGAGFGYTLAIYEEPSVLVDDFKTVLDLARAEVETLALDTQPPPARDQHVLSI
ncbi:MAG: hypothetical protein ACK4VI_03155 [Alphaproteobacteria bacterium]